MFTWLLHIKLFDVAHVLAQGILEVLEGHLGADDVTAAQHDGRGEHYHPPAGKGKINCNCRTRAGRRCVHVQDSQVVLNTAAAPSAKILKPKIQALQTRTMQKGKCVFSSLVNFRSALTLFFYRKLQCFTSFTGLCSHGTTWTSFLEKKKVCICCYGLRGCRNCTHTHTYTGTDSYSVLKTFYRPTGANLFPCRWPFSSNLTFLKPHNESLYHALSSILTGNLRSRVLLKHKPIGTIRAAKDTL